jgi:hypothetical protein
LEVYQGYLRVRLVFSRLIMVVLLTSAHMAASSAVVAMAFGHMVRRRSITAFPCLMALGWADSAPRRLVR